MFLGHFPNLLFMPFLHLIHRVIEKFDVLASFAFHFFDIFAECRFPILCILTQYFIPELQLKISLLVKFVFTLVYSIFVGQLRISDALAWTLVDIGMLSFPGVLDSHSVSMPLDRSHCSRTWLDSETTPPVLSTEVRLP